MTLPPLGIDVSKADFTVHLITGPKPRIATFANTAAGFEKLSAWLVRWGVPCVHACLESTGIYGEALAVWLSDHGHTVSVVNPARVKAYAESELSRAKTDTADSGVIARFCQAQRPEPWVAPTQLERELVALSRRLASLEGMRRQEAARLDVAATDAVRTSIRAHLAYLDEQIAQTKQQIDDLMGGDDELRKRRRLLQTITGVGPVLSRVMVAEVFGERDRFRHSKQVVAMVGVSPKPHESGTSVRRRARMCKMGGQRVRPVLYMAAMAAVRTNPVIRRQAERLRAAGKSEMVVLGAAMRKLVVVCYGVLKTGKPFDPALT
jgi:transposase